MPVALNKEKARRAAAHKDRPGEQCRAEPGQYVPVIDRSRCEGKRDCAEVCPYGVLTCAASTTPTLKSCPSLAA